MRTPSSPLSAASACYLEALEQRYRVDPDSVEPDWRCVFDVVRELESSEADRSRVGMESAIAAAFRDHGHLAARLDPLGLVSPVLSDDLLPPQIAKLAIRSPRWNSSVGGDTELIERLRSAYCGTLGIETAHIDDPRLRRWVYDAVESSCQPLSSEVRRRALELVVAAEEFERFMSVKFPTKKRFGADGGETLVPLLDHLLRRAANAGMTDVLIGTMHRGRLNITANVLAKPLAQLLGEFKGKYPFAADKLVAADVPYHLGLDSDLIQDGRPLRVTLAPNPSHLEAVKPVVLGRARARQDRAVDPRHVLAILIHTDASVAAQGIVAETLQLGGPVGFTTAGTVHIVVNNQIGFTTDTQEARTSRYCTGSWKAVNSLVLHANGDDPDAALRASDLAFDYRQAHAGDAVIDLVCYRRNGHNEIDEPRFTHPVLYRAIDQHPPISALYAARLTADGVAHETDRDAFQAASQARLRDGFTDVDNYRPNHGDRVSGSQSIHNSDLAALRQRPTGVALARLRLLLAALSTTPDDLSIGQKVDRLVRQRADGVKTSVPWALGEALAFATLLAEGTDIRLSGQDVVRGAFSHRHFALTDTETGLRHISLNHLGIPQARFDVVNSPLSEYAVLGFEYGYSLERPDALVIWEAQFGDFANGAQIIIDQFVVSGEEKWQQPSGLVMLLPHGLEGQGPEHSSARIERFLQLAARDNLQIVQPSTPANYFHLLRRQILFPIRKPLAVMTPKWLLRLPAAVSPIDEFGPGSSFRPVITSRPSGQVRAVLICSGKIAYDLERESSERNATDVAILRIEQFYPLPDDALLEVFREWRNAQFIWVQEEPENMGAWTFLDRRLEGLLRQARASHPFVSCVARPESPSPAGSFHIDHDRDQKLLFERAFECAAQPIERQASA